MYFICKAYLHFTQPKHGLEIFYIQQHIVENNQVRERKGELNRKFRYIPQVSILFLTNVIQSSSNISFINASQTA